MRIGLNLLYMIPGVVGGTETYAMGLLEGLRQVKPDYDFVLFLNRESSKLFLDHYPRFESVVCPVDGSNRKVRYYFEQVKLNRYIRDHGIDLLHSLGYTAPLLPPCPSVVSVPDLNFKAFGNLMSYSRRTMLSVLVKQAILRSQAVISISEFSRQEILKAYHVPSEKVVVTHLAASLDAMDQQKKNKPGNIFLGLGEGQSHIVGFSASYPNKNIPRLIEAYLKAKKATNLRQKLVLIGHKPEKVPIDLSTDDILWTGYIERWQVFDVLRSADFLVFPSFYEGFGLPVLEAMAAEVPVVCSNTASLPEVAGDAAVFFNPFSIDDMANAISNVATDVNLRNDLVKRGSRNLRRFSWNDTALKTLAVYDSLLNKPSVTQFSSPRS